jgi:hypothetical protein
MRDQITTPKFTSPPIYLRDGPDDEIRSRLMSETDARVKQLNFDVLVRNTTQ